LKQSDARRAQTPKVNICPHLSEIVFGRCQRGTIFRFS